MEPFTVDFNIFTAIFIPYLDTFHLIIILGIIDTDGRLDDQSGLRFYELGIQVGSMSMERTYTIRSIQIILFFLTGNNINGAPQSIRTQAGRNYPFIYFHPVNDIDRKICQRDTASFCIQRHPIDKVTDGIA